MNYKLTYMRLMLRAQERELAGYTETHHIIPRSLGGTDAASNLVQLTVREHWLAHCLLVRMHPDKPNLVFALEAMGLPNRLHPERRALRLKRWQRKRIAFRKAALLRAANKGRALHRLALIYAARHDAHVEELFAAHRL